MMAFKHLKAFELRQICYFLAVVEAGNNISRAAQQLGMSQPPLTQRIQALESLLSVDKASPVQLFNRKKRPIQLTAAGEAFLIEAREALSHLDRAVNTARQAHKGEIGRLAVGTNNSIANTVLPEVVQTFQQQFPNVELALHEVTIQQEMTMLKNQQLDVIFQRSPHFLEDDPTLSFKTILEEYFIVALPSHHPLAKHTKISISTLSEEVMILPSLDVLPYYERVLALCRESGFEPNISQTATVTGVVMLLSLVAAGVGISILPNHVQTLSREGVVYRPLKGADLTRKISVVWRENDPSVVLSKFLQVIGDVTGMPLFDSW